MKFFCKGGDVRFAYSIPGPSVCCSASRRPRRRGRRGRRGRRRRGGRPAAVEVYVEPPAVAPVPHAGLLRLEGARDTEPSFAKKKTTVHSAFHYIKIQMFSSLVDDLRDPDVGDDRGVVAQQVDVGVDDADVLLASAVGFG